MYQIPMIGFEEVESVIDPEELIEEICECFKLYSMKRTVTPPRTVMYVEGNWWGIMTSYIPGRGVGVKVVSVIPDNPKRGLRTTQALVTLYDHETGLPLIVMDGTSLTAHRTAATTAASIKFMWRSKGGTLGLIGAGFQGRYQVLYAYNVMKPDRILIYDIVKKASERLSKELSRKLDAEIKSVSSLKDLLEGSHVVIEATTCKEPVIIGKYLKPPTHIISIGAHTPTERAIDDDTIRLAEVYAVDSREATSRETGDVIQPLESGILKLEDLVELGEIALGLRPGRVGKGITIFKTVGIAVEDTCAAYYVLRKLSRKAK